MPKIFQYGDAEDGATTVRQPSKTAKLKLNFVMSKFLFFFLYHVLDLVPLINTYRKLF